MNGASVLYNTFVRPFFLDVRKDVNSSFGNAVVTGRLHVEMKYNCLGSVRAYRCVELNSSNVFVYFKKTMIPRSRVTPDQFESRQGSWNFLYRVASWRGQVLFRSIQFILFSVNFFIQNSVYWKNTSHSFSILIQEIWWFARIGLIVQFTIESTNLNNAHVWLLAFMASLSLKFIHKDYHPPTTLTSYTTAVHSTNDGTNGYSANLVVTSHFVQSYGKSRNF